MGLFEARIKFEKLLIRYKIFPLTLAYHGSFWNERVPDNDIDVVLIVSVITPELFRKLNRVAKNIKPHLGITLVSTREAGTIFGGSKYYDALHRDLGYEKSIPHAHYKIASLNQLFRKEAVHLNFKKCVNIAKVITKTINNYLGSELSLNVKNFEKLVDSLEKNLDYFYNAQKIKPRKYTEDIPLKY